MRVVFMGTPDFAAAALQAIIDADINVVGAYTKPDRPRNRGMKMSFSPVKEIAVKAGLPVFQPESLNTAEALEELKALKPDILAVVAYGKILPQSILDVPTKGSINIHASLLPKYRGSAPIQWAILNGDEKTGLTAMYLAPEMDTGDIICCCETEIGEFETSGELFDRLKLMGGELLTKTLRNIEQGNAPCKTQDHDCACYVKPLSKDMSPIDWTKSPREIVKWICGLDPWPCATAEFGGTTFKIFGAEYTDNKTDKKPGSVIATSKKGIEVACGNGETLLITQLQAPGKKRMDAGSYLLGNSIPLD